MRSSSNLMLQVRKFNAHARLGQLDSGTPVALQHAIEAAYYRGGTSRAVIIQPRHLPRQRAKWSSIFRQIMGSGDPYGRQLDGMGAGISSLSKICLVEPYGKRSVRTQLKEGSNEYSLATRGSVQGSVNPTKKKREEVGIDIDYTFVGMGIEGDEVDVAGNCGNMTSAVGPYAYNAGLLPAWAYSQGDGEVTVTIRNTNTGKIILSTFSATGGQAAVVGDQRVDGVAGTGATVALDFKDPYGSKTGKVLPTGKKVDMIHGYEVTCVDGATPAVFVRATDVGIDGTILPKDFEKLTGKLTLLEKIRRGAAVAMGMVATEDLTPRVVPKLGIVSLSSSHNVLGGELLETTHMDCVVRFLSDGQPHRAIPLTAALTTAVAARIPGTIVEQSLATVPATEGLVTIGHASGRIHVNATMEKTNSYTPTSATLYRTAKRLFEGRAFYTEHQAINSASDVQYGSSGSHSLGLAYVLESRGQSSSQLFENNLQEQNNHTDDAPEKAA